MNSIRLLLVISTLLIVLSAAPFKKELVKTCNYFGYIMNNKCKCISGTSGEFCNEYKATMCDAHGKCPHSWQYCAHFNTDCLFTSQCKDKRGFCMPINHAPNSIFHDTTEF